MAAMKLTQNVIPEVSVIENGNVIPLRIVNREVDSSPLVTAIQNGLGEIEFCFPSDINNKLKQIDALNRIATEAKAKAAALELEYLPEFLAAFQEHQAERSAERKSNKVAHKQETVLPFRKLLSLGLALGLTVGLAFGLTEAIPKAELQAELHHVEEHWVKEWQTMFAHVNSF